MAYPASERQPFPHPRAAGAVGCQWHSDSGPAVDAAQPADTTVVSCAAPHAPADRSLAARRCQLMNEVLAEPVLKGKAFSI